MIEWTQPGRFITDVGTLEFNEAIGSGARYLLDQSKCKASRSLRVTSDPVPQGDGEIFHRRFTDGIELTFAVRLWYDEKPACGGTARAMYELLAWHLSAMLNDESGRYIWQPDDYGDERMADRCRWLTPTTLSYGNNGEVTVEFSIDTPYPYFIDKTQREILLPDGVVTPVPMVGNADFYPVLLVDGPFTGFIVANGSTSEGIVYDGSRPGASDVLAGDYAELDMYRMTIFENGFGQSLKAGIDPMLTDYFFLQPGANMIEIAGADGRLLVNDAWLP